MRINKNIPNAVTYGLVRYRGMEMPHTYTSQDQLQVPYLIKALRWDKTVANNLLTNTRLHPIDDRIRDTYNGEYLRRFR